MIDSVYVLSRAISVIAVVIGIFLLAPLMRTSWLVSGVMLGLFALEASLWVMAVNDVYGGREDD